MPSDRRREGAATLLWLRRDLRLTDNPALAAALARGGSVAPVFILDEATRAWGAAARWRLGESLADLSDRVAALGGRLILRRGDPLEVLRALARETGADGVIWSRLYDRDARARDARVKAALRAEGVEARSVNGALLVEPWEIETTTGGPYRVYTPFMRAARRRDFGEPAPAPTRIPPLATHPASEPLASWRLGAAMNRGAAVLAGHARVGEEAALARLSTFVSEDLEHYAARRDRLDLDGTSGLSAHLAFGEISPRTAWRAALPALERGGGLGAETFLKELLWREFAYHLLYHFPDLPDRAWREGWDDFPWRGDNADAEAWRRGRTGEPLIDAAMRQLYVLGSMHNRARMLVASYLTKHLMTDWRVGAAWFAETLIDWDPASNAMGWQWVAGCGPDAAPFFRVFNPATQADRFDPDGAYRRRWLSEESGFAQARPRSWGADGAPTRPLVDLAAGRARALSAYQRMRRDPE